MAAETSRNSLISTKPSDSGLHVALHPLVLLTSSDHITRHAARQQQGPIVGALLGQQQGREISLEHAFECHTTNGSHNEVLLHHDWFSERVQQCMICYYILTSIGMC
jgi:COP9 signalosome complex subunit 6